MDQKTLNAYSAKASEYSHDWLAQPEPTDMYKLLKEYFRPGLETADIGCGNGRDANWLSQNGFKAVGYDSSLELLNLAATLYPQIQFKQAFLPSLSEIQNQFDNLLCETVIMHLPQAQILESLKNLKRLLKKDGVLYLSWRVTEGTDIRHNDGRLYSAFEPSFVLNQFSKSSILHFEDKTSESSGKRVCRLIISGE
ncbi:class I SAM-dependent methyltransferase [Bdellovibrio sp. HCB2-146]|uniref:class I SAM-dependent methyltransferase n=1 Tax=Bdellovibrio sp. HCB2-146 TaxID=3394362 RepID=UPI0039BC6490